MLSGDYGREVSGLSSSFTGDSNKLFMERLTNIERLLSKGSINPFFSQINTSTIPNIDHRSILKNRMLEAMGMTDPILGGVGELVARGYEDTPAPSGAVFRVLKEATGTETGVGRFVFGADTFVGQSGRNITEEMLGIITSSITIDPSEAAGQQLSLGGKNVSSSTLKSTTQQINRLRVDDSMSQATRLVLDLETAGVNYEGPWQISARLVKGNETLETKNLLIDNSRMDVGRYIGPDGTAYSSSREYFEKARGVKGTWGTPQQAIEGLYDMMNRADYLVGQNISFDIDQITATMNRYGMLSGEGAEEAKKFLAAITSTDRVVDTRLLAMPLLNPTIGVNDASTVSLENIYMQTSFFQDLEDKYSRLASEGKLEGKIKAQFFEFINQEAIDMAGGNRIRAAIYGRINQGIHLGDVDTFFENELFDFLGRRYRGEDVLRTYGPGSSAPLPDEIMGAIRGASAITPTTTLPGMNINPIQASVVEHRKALGGFSIDDYMGVPPSLKDLALDTAGQFDRLVDSSITAAGKVRDGARLASLGEFGVLRDEMVAGGRMFQFSPQEAILNTLIGRVSANPRHVSAHAMDAVNEARGLVGDVLQGGIFQGTKSVDLTSGGRNVQLPLSVLQRAEAEGILTGTNFRGLADSPAQALGLSPFRAGEDITDVALVAKIGDQSEVLADYLGKLLNNPSESDFLEEIGLSRSKLDEVQMGLRKYGERFGVQIGILGGKNKPSVEQLFGYMESIGISRDAKNSMSLTTYLATGADEFVEAMGDSNLLLTSGAFIDVPGTSTQEMGTIAARQVAEMANQIPSLDRATKTSIRMGKAVGGSSPRKIFRGVSQAFENAPKKLGIGAALAGSLLLFGGYRRSQQYDYVFDEQEYEDPGDYADYKQSLGEPGYVFGNQPVARSAPQSMDGLVQELNRNRTGHHRMGSGKNDHLFGR